MHAFRPAHVRIFFSKLIVCICLGAALTVGSAFAQTCPFDDGHSSLEVEGLILTRYALGITGAPLVASTGINAVDAPTVEASINCPSCGLNITGNPSLTVADATIISRKLAGFNGASLTDGVALGSGTRNTPAAVQSFLLSGCGATGGTVTSITAGTGLTGGVITGSGTIAADTAYLQRRVSSACTGGSFITTIAADGTVTCGTPTVGGGGTVTNVATGAGLAGGPITATGTINLAATQLLPTTACAANQIAKWSGSSWTCAADATGGAGTVTSVATGTGLTGGPISSAGTVALASSYQLPQSCASNQIAKWNGSSWICAADNDVNNVTNDARYFKQGGNAYGAPAVFGTTDGQPLTVGIGGGTGLRISASSLADAPTITHGSSANTASGISSTIGGGGSPVSGCYNAFSQQVNNQPCANSAAGDYSTVGGGRANAATGLSSAIGGGNGNIANGPFSTISGGNQNLASSDAAGVGGGVANIASGIRSWVSGGGQNSSTGSHSSVGGGLGNVGGGSFAVIPGGWGAATRLTGQMAHASGFFGAFNAPVGTAQASEYVLRAETTDATVTSLFLDGTAATLLFEAGRAALLDIQIVALQNNAAGNIATWSFKCMYQVNPGGNGFVVPAGCGKTAVQKDGTASTWEATVIKGASQELLITATGEAAKSIRWVATVRATEVKW